MTVVPAQYHGWVTTAAARTGLPPSVVAAQINTESGFNPRATSPTGAEGIAQFEPSTWAGLGISGSPYNPTAALDGYVKLMSQLLSQYHGNVREALAAYNAGSGNLAAGYGYADSILSAAGQSRLTIAGKATNPSTPGAMTGAVAGSDWTHLLLDVALVGLGMALLFKGGQRTLTNARAA